MSFAATRMDLEIIILSEVNQTEKKYCMTSLTRGIKKETIQMNLQNRKRLTDREQTQDFQEGRDNWGLWEGHVHIVIYKMDKQQEPTVQHRKLCSMLCGSLDGRGVGGEWIHAYVWLSPFAVHLKLSQHWQLAILQYKINFFFLKNAVFRYFRGNINMSCTFSNHQTQT